MKYILFILLCIFIPFLSFSQILYFKAVRIQVILNDSTGHYMLTGQEFVCDLNIEFNFNNEIIHSNASGTGDFNIKTSLGYYTDSFDNQWSNFAGLDKDGKGCGLRLCMTPNDKLFNAYFYVDYPTKVAVYKMVKDFSKVKQ